MRNMKIEKRLNETKKCSELSCADSKKEPEKKESYN